MCLWFDSCFSCGGQDYGHELATPKHPAAGASAWNGDDHGQQRNGYHGSGHNAPYQTAADEAGRKGHNDPRKDRAVVAGAAATRDSAADETLKLPARNSKVGDDTGYIPRFYEPAHQKENTKGYLCPTAATTIATYY